MTPEKRAKLDEEDLPLDLSVVKVCKIEERNDHENISEIIDFNKNRSDIAVSSIPPLTNIADIFLAIECQLNVNIEKSIRFSSPIEYVYNPIIYAFEVHSMYVRKYCQGRKKLLFFGMNAGPWGMSQTGVPFGEVDAVTNWLQLSGFVGKPLREHPARKVTGFACRRSEVSGKRFWSLIRQVCGTPENFFRHCFLHNYCPIALMDVAGRNITPAELKGTEQQILQASCDYALVQILKLLGVEIIVSIGRFTEKRARTVVSEAGLSTRVLYIPHPSPRSPSNVNWVKNTRDKLRELNILHFLNNDVDCGNSSGNS